jgi:DNA-binding MarR family transcriptional regulator
MRFAAALRPLGLTHVQFVLLACIWSLDHKSDVPNQMTLARQAGTDVKMSSHVLRTLETKGLLQRQVDPHGGRARQLCITPSGTELARRAIIEVERVDADVSGPPAPDSPPS